MLTTKRLVAAGVATFIAGILLTFPARVPYSWFSSPEFRLSGISGTVWRGGAAEGDVGGLYLRDLRWTFQPLAIFRGRLAYRVDSDSAYGSIGSVIGLSLDGSLILQEFSSTFALEAFRDLFALQGFNGTLHADFDSIVLQNGFPTAATGRLILSDLLAPQLSPQAIGNFRADFTSSADGIVGLVEDNGGVLDVAGTISLGLDRRYSFVGTVAALPDAPAGLSNQLRFLGSPDARGYREFRVEGQL